MGDRERDRARGDAVANAILVEQVAAVTLEDSDVSGTLQRESILPMSS